MNINNKITYYDESERRFKELKNGKVKNAKTYETKPVIKILDKIYIYCLIAWVVFYYNVLWHILPNRFRKEKK
jgi:hypothetical protein